MDVKLDNLEEILENHFLLPIHDLFLEPASHDLVMFLATTSSLRS